MMKGGRIGLKRTTSRKKRLAAQAALLTASMLLLPACTVVSLDSPSAATSGGGMFDESFDAEGFVSTEWERTSKYFDDNADDIVEVLSAIAQDPEQAGETYGVRSGADGAPWNFVVKGEARVLAVNTESRAGTLDIDLAPFDGTKDATVQIGPVIKGTSIRDSLDFVKFDQFKNQIQYAQLANALNKRANEQALAGRDPASLAGQQVRFTGAFTAGSSIVITPVKLELVEGGG